MNQKQILLTAIILGFVSVALGAFGAHALKALLEGNGRTDTFELAVRYQFYHALVLLFIGTHAGDFYKVSAALFLCGIVLFSGSLYFLALTNSTALVMLTPIGGLFLLAGWAWLAWTVYKRKK
jgi:uncharacterized membrane protein YgdD (TMEM256/DUF423 family)